MNYAVKVNEMLRMKVIEIRVCWWFFLVVEQQQNVELLDDQDNQFENLFNRN